MQILRLSYSSPLLSFVSISFRIYLFFSLFCLNFFVFVFLPSFLLAFILFPASFFSSSHSFVPLSSLLHPVLLLLLFSFILLPPPMPILSFTLFRLFPFPSHSSLPPYNLLSCFSHSPSFVHPIFLTPPSFIFPPFLLHHPSFLLSLSFQPSFSRLATSFHPPLICLPLLPILSNSFTLLRPPCSLSYSPSPALLLLPPLILLVPFLSPRPSRSHFVTVPTVRVRHRSICTAYRCVCACAFVYVWLYMYLCECVCAFAWLCVYSFVFFGFYICSRHPRKLVRHDFFFYNPRSLGAPTLHGTLVH